MTWGGTHGAPRGTPRESSGLPSGGSSIQPGFCHVINCPTSPEANNHADSSHGTIGKSNNTFSLLRARRTRTPQVAVAADYVGDRAMPRARQPPLPRYLPRRDTAARTARRYSPLVAMRRRRLLNSFPHRLGRRRTRCAVGRDGCSGRVERGKRRRHRHLACRL